MSDSYLIISSFWLSWICFFSNFKINPIISLSPLYCLEISLSFFGSEITAASLSRFSKSLNFFLIAEYIIIIVIASRPCTQDGEAISGQNILIILLLLKFLVLFNQRLPRGSRCGP